MVTLFCFAFFSVQKSRPDASKSNYVIDGVRGILRGCLGKQFASSGCSFPAKGSQWLAALFFIFF